MEEDLEDFDAQFADELEMMQEINDPEFDPEPRSRKSLHFTPHAKQKQPPANLNDSFPTPLDSPTEKSSADNQDGEAGRKSKKRLQSDMYGNVSADEEEEESLPDITPQRKRARVRTGPREVEDIPDFDDDFEITPPPSPDVSDVIKMQRNSKAAVRLPASETLEQYQDRLVKDYDYERQRLLSRIPDGDFVGVTTMEGKRLYMNLKDEKELEREEEAVVSGQKSLQLLSAPMSVLKDKVEEERQQKLLAESQRITESLSQEDMDLLLEDRVEEVETDGQAPKKRVLWVEQYAPKRYTDLMSDEGTNRMLLHWLKLWDCVVFGKEKRVKKEPKKKDNKKQQQQQAFFQKKGILEIEEEMDAHDRPFHKVVLMCGPPGLGKTTLAHVVASHAGYNVVEMNASDDRSAEIFKTKIEAATQMKAVIGADPRPNCLVIDEIDGAPLPAINMLLSIIKGETNKGKKKKGPGLLLRPIICICNDLYVPSLRILRQNAMVVHFKPSSASKLATRLLQISKDEGIKTDLSTLIALCEKADNDIRSCINTLQFVQRRMREFTINNVQSMSIGQKDAHKSLFSVWQEIFKMPKAKRKTFVNPHDRTEANSLNVSEFAGQNSTTLSARFQNIFMLAMAGGDTEKLTQGIFENYLDVKMKDSRMHAVNLANDWLCFTDMLNKQIGQTQNYTLFRYLNYLPVAFHLLFATNAQTKIQYPHQQYEAHVKLGRSENLITSMMNDMAPAVRKHLNTVVTTMELLPPLMEIIQPTLRPVNTQLYSAREKEGLALLIKIMIAYNMTYHQERSIEGQYSYVLDPNMDEVVHFSGLKQKQQLTYAAKQLIAREIELEKMRRTEDTITTKRNKMNPSKKADPEMIPTHKRQTLQPKAITEKADAPCKDFFGRTVVVPEMTEQQKKDTKRHVLSGDIWYKFKAGYSNAVRKTVRLQDLL